MVLACAAAAAVLALAVDAHAHGGNYQPPPEKGTPGWVPPSRDPRPAPPTGGGPFGGPTTPSGGGGGPTTGGGGLPGPPGPGPSTGGGPLGGPSTGGGPSNGGPPTVTGGGKPKIPGRERGPSATLSNGHWSRWWYANRTFVIDLHARAGERGRVVTPSAKGATRAELWREQAQMALLKALDSRSEDVASGAAIALGKAGDPAVAKQLRAVLANGKRQVQVREAAALALGLVGVESDAAQARETRRVLEGVATGGRGDDRLRAMAVYALGLRGDAAALPFLMDVAAYDAATWDVPAAGATALGMTGNEMTTEDLVRLLNGPKRKRDREMVARVYAAHGLARAGDPAALPALRDAARDRDDNVRRGAILALGAIAESDDAETAKVLHFVLNRDKDDPARDMAALSIGRVGDPQAERALRYWYKKGNNQHRTYAALGLGLLARKTGDKAIPKLLARDFERRANADLRGALAIAIGLAGDSAHAAVIRDVAADRGNPELRAHCAVALGMLGDRQAAPPILRQMLRKKGDPVLVREAALALGLLGDRESIDVLLELVVEEDSVYVQGSAAVALGRIGGAESAKALIDLLENEGRPQLARAMGAVGLGLLLDRSEGRRLDRVGADLNWYVLTPTVREILTIL